MEWPTTDVFNENEIKMEPEGIDKELTIQYWFEKIVWNNMQTQMTSSNRKQD